MEVWKLVFSMFPAWFQVAVLGVLALLAIILIFKLVGMVLNAIPFL